MSTTQSVMLNPQGGLTFCDLSHGWRSNCAAGPLYPCYVEETLPGDYASISFSAEVKTESAVAPTMGTYDCYIETFFCRMANYYSQLHTNLPNAPMLEPGVGSFHTISPVEKGNAAFVSVPGSIFDYMGLGVNVSWCINDPTNRYGYTKRLPLVPFACYYDIFRAWYCDPQSPYFYCGGISYSDAGDSVFAYRQGLLSNLIESLQDIYNATEPIMGSTPQQANISALFDGTVPHCLLSFRVQQIDVPYQVMNLGLLLGPYRADMMNNFLSSETVSSMLSRARINVVNSSITFDQIVATEKTYDFDNRSVLSGGRYRDWVRAQYNVTPSTDLCQPQFLGRVHWTVGFQDVVASTAAQGQSLGDLGGRGFGQTGKTYPIRMSFSDNGYIFSIFRIVPRLDYNSYVEPYLQRLNTEDIFTPAYDNSPFEPVFYWDIDARTSSSKAGTSPSVIGYRPAWTGYRHRVNRSHGSFAVGSQSFWVLQRSFTDIDPSDSLHSHDEFTPYINPVDANSPFAVTDLSAMNFRVQIGISSKWRRPIKSNSLPSLK